jgi:hypothetical protein
MAIIDDRTTNLNLPLPNVGNKLVDDVARLRTAISGVDSVVALKSDKGTTLHSYGITDALSTNSNANIPLSDADISSFLFISNSTINEQVLDSFSYTAFGAAKYIIYASCGLSKQVCELLILHDGVTPISVEYANLATTLLTYIHADIVDGSVRLLITPSVANINFKVLRTLLTI